MLSFVLSLALCLLTADFASGLFHWFEDTWLVPGKNAFFDKYIILCNIEHHRSPGKMKANDWWNNNYVTMALVGLVAVVCLLFGVHAWQIYLTLAIASQSNQIHAWGHTRKVPYIIGFLQRYGILQSIEHHGLHHKRPYDARYCTTTNFLNPVLDRIKFWRGLERIGVKLGGTVARGSQARQNF